MGHWNIASRMSKYFPWPSTLSPDAIGTDFAPSVRAAWSETSSRVGRTTVRKSGRSCRRTCQHCRPSLATCKVIKKPTYLARLPRGLGKEYLFGIKMKQEDRGSWIFKGLILSIVLVNRSLAQLEPLKHATLRDYGSWLPIAT